MSGNSQITAIYVFALGTLDNQTLASIYMMISGFGKTTIGTKAHQKAIDLDLIETNGMPKCKDELLNALSFVINKRVDEGKFV